MKFHGEQSQGWLILRNGDATVGLFQGMFERNSLTFNPGWDADAQPVASFTDVRELQKQLREAGVEFSVEADESGSGPAFFIVADPDGNPVFVEPARLSRGLAAFAKLDERTAPLGRIERRRPVDSLAPDLAGAQLDEIDASRRPGRWGR